MRRRRGAPGCPRARGGANLALGVWTDVRPGPSGWPAFVNTYGRWMTPSSARPTTSSEWPKPYCAAVSIQLAPSSRARWIAAIDSSSSWLPHPQSQPAPPIAHAPTPARVIERSVLPSGTVVREPTVPRGTRRDRRGASGPGSAGSGDGARLRPARRGRRGGGRGRPHPATSRLRASGRSGRRRR